MVLAPIFGNTTSTTASSTLPSPLDPPDQRSLRMGRDTPSPEVLNPKKRALFSCAESFTTVSLRGGVVDSPRKGAKVKNSFVTDRLYRYYCTTKSAAIFGPFQNAINFGQEKLAPPPL